MTTTTTTTTTVTHRNHQNVRQIGSIVHSITHHTNQIQQKWKGFIARDGPIRKDYENLTMFFKEASFMFGYIFAGWNDSTAGAILPAIQKRYKLSYALVSLLFVSNLIGWILAAILTPELLKKFTVGRSVTLTASIAIIPAAIIASGSPFPLMAIMYCLFGLSVGSMEAIANSWIAARPNRRIRLACLHFSYGVGALLAPLAGTPFVVKGLDFHHFYFASLGLCVLNTVFITSSFRLRKEGYPGEQQPQQHQPSQDQEQIELQTLSMHTPDDARSTRQGYEKYDDLHSEAEAEGSRGAIDQNQMESSIQPATVNALGSQEGTGTQWKTLLRQKDSHIFAFFCLFYVGTEVSIGGWTSTYIIKVRGDIDQSGHIVSGFWAGLAAGRILLLPITNLLGAQLAVIVYLLLSIALQLIIWLVPNVIANAVAVAMIGLLLGPIFPIMIELISFRIIPRSIQTRAIAYVVSFGSAGAALFPLLIGEILQFSGAKYLAPILFTCLSIQLAIFLLFGIPKSRNATGEAQRAIE